MKKTTLLNLIILLMLNLSSGVAAVSQDSGQVSQNVEKLWSDFNPRKDPLEIEVVDEWDDGDGHFKLVRFSLGELKGTNKIAKPMMAAYYGYPKGKKDLPAILHLHGGGQRAGKGYVKYWVSLGYAAISINWGAKVLEDANTPNTDWDGLAAGFIGDRDQKHHNDQMPGQNTLFREPHLFNSSWSLIAIASRRALTFLEQQPQVDGSRLGLTGHSMGGRATVLTAIDPRIKAASPSVGGSGYLYDDLWGLAGSGRHMEPKTLAFYNKLVDCRVYWPLIKCPILFLGATNDFNSPTDLIIRAILTASKTTDIRLALAPHLNHRFTSNTFAARVLWFESHLKGNFKFPKTARTRLILKQADGIPLFKVWPDTDTKLAIKKVDIYYSYGRLPQVRFWRDGQAKKAGACWQAKCPVFYADEPLFAFANITYELDREIPLPAGYSRTIREVSFSSEYQSAYPPKLQNAGVKATEKQQRQIDDFSRGWHDWYTLSLDNTHHWFFATRKIIDPSWVGPKDGKIAFEIDNPVPGNKLAVVAAINEWQSFTGRKKDTFTAVVDLDKKAMIKVALSTSDFKNDKGQSIKDWDEITELSFRPADKALPGNKSFEPWQGNVPALDNLRWEGGVYVTRPKPHESAGERAAYYNSAEFDNEFQKAIEASVKLEKEDEKIR